MHGHWLQHSSCHPPKEWKTVPEHSSPVEPNLGFYPWQVMLKAAWTNFRGHPRQDYGGLTEPEPTQHLSYYPTPRNLAVVFQITAERILGRVWKGLGSLLVSAHSGHSGRNSESCHLWSPPLWTGWTQQVLPDLVNAAPTSKELPIYTKKRFHSFQRLSVFKWYIW